MESITENKLAREYNFISLITYSIPTIVMMVFMAIYTMVDGVFVSRLINTDALSAVNIVYPLASLVMALGIMLAAGSSAVVAKKMGEGKAQEAKEDFTMITIVAVIVGIFFTVFGLLFLRPLMELMGANDILMPYCVEYARTLLSFAVPAMLLMLFQSLFVTAGHPGIGLVVVIGGGVTNIALDYVFLAILGMGIEGAALATGIGYTIPALIGVFWFFIDRNGQLYFVKPEYRGYVLLKSITNGASELVTNLAVAIVTLLFNLAMMALAGEDGVAALTIVFYAEGLLTAVYYGFSTGTAPILSYNFGENNNRQLRKLIRNSLIFLMICSVVSLVIAVICAKPIVEFFASGTPAVIEMAVKGFYLYSICFLFMGINVYASALFTALSDGRRSIFLSFMRTLVFVVLGIMILPNIWDINGVWLTIPIAELLSIILSVVMIYRLYGRLEISNEKAVSCV